MHSIFIAKHFFSLIYINCLKKQTPTLVRLYHKSKKPTSTPVRL